MTGRDWQSMSRDAFDTTAAAPTLFDATPGMVPAAEPTGTGDLLALLEADPERHATDHEIDLARAYGAHGYVTDLPTRAPAASDRLMALIGAAPVGEPRTIELMHAYGAGWDYVADAEAATILGNSPA